jgi:hypothetical protein
VTVPNLLSLARLLFPRHRDSIELPLSRSALSFELCRNWRFTGPMLFQAAGLDEEIPEPNFQRSIRFKQHSRARKSSTWLAGFELARTLHSARLGSQSGRS